MRVEVIDINVEVEVVLTIDSDCRPTAEGETVEGEVSPSPSDVPPSESNGDSEGDAVSPSWPFVDDDNDWACEEDPDDGEYSLCKFNSLRV